VAAGGTARHSGTVYEMDGGSGGRRALLVTGVVLTGGLLVLLAFLVFTSPPVWLWSMLALSPWGPIALGFWVFLARRDRFARRLRETGIRTRGTISGIGQTASRIGGRPVLRLHLLLVDSARQVVVRTAPPAHLLGALRPGVALPVLVEREQRGRVLLDWHAAEREL
jgi:hypothetical protein